MLLLKLFTYRLWLKGCTDMGERHLGITSSFSLPVRDKSELNLHSLFFFQISPISCNSKNFRLKHGN